MRDKEYQKRKSRESYLRNKHKVAQRGFEGRARNRAIMLIAKVDGCRICDEAEPSCLDFHHVGRKTFTIGSASVVSEERLRSEISNCVVLCANCHRKLHAGVICLPK